MSSPERPSGRPPGHRRAAPVKKAAKVPKVVEEEPRAISPQELAATTADRSLRPLSLLWLAVIVGVTGVLVFDRFEPLPDLPAHLTAGVLTVALAFGLAHRTGGRPIWAALLASAGVAIMVVTDWEPLLAGGAVATAVLCGTLAVMGTVAAPTFKLAIREVALASALACVGAFGAAAYDVEVDVTRYDYVVLSLALAAAIALVYRLGAGLHGLGRRGYIVAGGSVVLLAFALAYSEAFGQWGSPELVSRFDDVRMSARDALGAVPHPIEVLLGIPALVWGVFMRARRRQGWWVCAFGVAATAPTAARLVNTTIDLDMFFLGLAYSVIPGLLIGYAVIRLEQFLTGTHGRRARRDEESHALRPEPGRFEPLR